MRCIDFTLVEHHFTEIHACALLECERRVQIRGQNHHTQMTIWLNETMQLSAPSFLVDAEKADRSDQMIENRHTVRRHSKVQNFDCAR
jgi:hypothetical protein